MAEINPYLRWLVPIFCIMIVWISIFALLYFKADEVTKDPCGICAKRMGKTVMCTQLEQGITNPSIRYYYPNGTVEEPFKVDYAEQKEINFSKDYGN